MKIYYDTPIQVTEKQYNAVMGQCDGICAGQQKEGKFFIKVWLMKYKDYVKQVLELNKA